MVADNRTRATGRDVVEWAARAADLGAGEILLTSVEREDTREGYDLVTIRTVSAAVSMPVIAAGGAGTLQDLIDVVAEGHAAAAPSIFHFADQSPITTHSFMRRAGLDVRMVWQKASAAFPGFDNSRRLRCLRSTAWATVCKWVQWYRREGRAGLEDRSSAQEGVEGKDNRTTQTAQPSPQGAARTRLISLFPQPSHSR